MNELEEQIKVVAQARKVAEVEAQAKKIAYEQWEEDHSIMLGMVAESKQAVTDAEALLRELTLKAYKETGDKHPAKGVDIREVTTYSYNEDEALKWAIEHKMALKLDKDKFKNHVKADPPNFVTVSQEPQATISSNLEEIK